MTLTGVTVPRLLSLICRMGMLAVLAAYQVRVTIEWDDGEVWWGRAFQNLTCCANKRNYRSFLKKLLSSDQQILKQTSAMKRE